MKTLIILSSLTLIGCTKTWQCESTITTDQTSTIQIEFEGTKDEMKQYEIDGTKKNPSFTQVTKCK